MSRLRSLFKFSASIRLAVVVLLGLAVALIAGTFIESSADARTAQYYVYKSQWFNVVLLLLTINIAAVMVDRWPWKKRHTPFLLAHIGILILLAGSLITYQSGIDGLLRVEEGQSSGSVEIQDEILYLSEAKSNSVWAVPVPWKPRSELFSPMKVDFADQRVEVVEFLPYAENFSQWIESKQGGSLGVELQIQGGPMGIRQSFWISDQDSTTRFSQMGPALFEWVHPKNPPVDVPLKVQVTSVHPDLKSVEVSVLRAGEKPVHKRIAIGEPVLGVLKGAVELKVLQISKNIFRHTGYRVPRFLEGNRRLYQSAIRVRSGLETMWLGLGERGTLTVNGRDFEIAYLSKRVQLPFALMLERFNIERNPGTMDPASYWSLVDVPEQGKKVISMNEPLQHGGFTFYQSSYENAMPRPTVSIFSVNRDPGRLLKYLGSLILVGGIAYLFIEKSKKKRPV